MHGTVVQRPVVAAVPRVDLHAVAARVVHKPLEHLLPAWIVDRHARFAQRELHATRRREINGELQALPAGVGVDRHVADADAGAFRNLDVVVEALAVGQRARVDPNLALLDLCIQRGLRGGYLTGDSVDLRAEHLPEPRSHRRARHPGNVEVLLFLSLDVRPGVQGDTSILGLILLDICLHGLPSPL